MKLLLFLSVLFPQEPREFDVVVYTGTAGGALAAVAAGREGARVALLEPGRHIGGMVSGGLGTTDFGDRRLIGGLAAEFYGRVWKHYGVEPWHYRGPEPGVAERIFRDMLSEAKVEVLFDHRLDRVAKDGTRIREVVMENGARFAAAVFVDGGYEGDLLARAKVAYAVGRESVKKHGESWAGRQPIRPFSHQFAVAVNPFVDGKEGELLPFIHRKPLVPVGEGDGGVQGYCFRLCLTKRKENLLPFPKPEGYDPGEFELLRRLIAKSGRGGAGGIIYRGQNLPNEKCDVNSGGPFSTNLYDGSNWEYPDADDRKRGEIWERHLRYTQGLLYYLANDASVPEAIRKDMATWGLPKDEFADTGHFPHQLYIREARRMTGDYVMTQADLLERVSKDDSVGMGDYNIDIRHIQRTWDWVFFFPKMEAAVFNEGYISVPVKPYEIPYRALVPKEEECANLLVPVCVSASHVAYASIRMEPQYMILGHSAGVAAAMAARAKVAVQRIDVPELLRKLADQKQVLRPPRER
jgi:hypothetical protein